MVDTSSHLDRVQHLSHPRTDVPDRRTLPVYGVVVHTTGSGLPTRANNGGIAPLALASRVYGTTGAFGPHYVIGYDGAVLQIADEARKMEHAGINATERTAYLAGSWTHQVAQSTLALWRQKWPGVKSPLGLFPSTSVNEDYLGIECIPTIDRLPNKSHFTPEQYQALGELLRDIATRHGIQLAGARLLGHEDVNPLARWTSRGGWDPGALCIDPSFFWSEVRLGDLPAGAHEVFTS